MLRRFILHHHTPRNGTPHYDLRFEDRYDPKLLHSFACPKNFLDTMNDRSIIYKTRDHGNHWIELKSYRLETIDEGMVDIMASSKKYFKLVFKGKKLKGAYVLFRNQNARREDVWVFKKL